MTDAPLTELPEGLTDADAERWIMLSAERRARAIQRLEALASLKQLPELARERSQVIAAAQRHSGMGRSAFYAMVKRWNNGDRTLAALGVHATSNGPSMPAVDAQREEDREIIRRAMSEGRDPTLLVLQGELNVITGRRPSLQTIARHVREIRQTRAPQGAFGQELIFDSAGMDMIDGDTQDHMRLCAAIDGGTGLILGWDFENASGVITGYRAAALHALYGADRGSRLRTRHAGAGLRALDLAGVRASEGPTAVDAYHFFGDADGYGIDDEMAAAGITSILSKRTGAKLIELLGEKIGPIAIGTGLRPLSISFRANRQAELPQFTSTMEQLLGDVLDAYNERRLSLLPRDGSPVAMRAALERVTDRLTVFTQLKGDQWPVG